MFFGRAFRIFAISAAVCGGAAAFLQVIGAKSITDFFTGADYGKLVNTFAYVGLFVLVSVILAISILIRRLVWSISTNNKYAILEEGFTIVVEPDNIRQIVRMKIRSTGRKLDEIPIRYASSSTKIGKVNVIGPKNARYLFTHRRQEWTYGKVCFANPIRTEQAINVEYEIFVEKVGFDTYLSRQILSGRAPGKLTLGVRLADGTTLKDVILSYQDTASDHNGEKIFPPPEPFSGRKEYIWSIPDPKSGVYLLNWE